MATLDTPYLTDLDYSHTPGAQHNISPHQSPFETFEFSNLQGSSFPHTPSYNGSYQNSPFSGHSELSFGGEGEQYSLFDDQAAHINIREDYDPSEYDPPASSDLLMFGSGDFISGGSGDQQQNHGSVSLAPSQFDYSSPNALDYSSPSSNGGGDSGPDGQPASRRSSVSSNHNKSPRLDVTQGFENMRFESPNWGVRRLDRSLSPPNKPHSPPTLVIPTDASSPSANVFVGQDPPAINAPDGDGGLMGTGPHLNIVPATPVSGGGGASQPVPFQNTLETLHQGK